METITTKKRLYHPPMVKSIEKEQEDDFYYELSAEDIEKIDVQLYKKYKLNASEIKFIEENVK